MQLSVSFGILTVFACCLTFFIKAATFIVNTTSDSQSSGCATAPGDCILREAIQAANSSSGSDTINFDHPNLA